MQDRDKLFLGKEDYLVDFAFDRSVADVFTDMIRRSVPGYDALIAMIGCIAEDHAIRGTRVYDLGCSLGAAVLSMHSRISPGEVRYICVDNSREMLTRCGSRLESQLDRSLYDLVHQDIRETEITNASVVVMNFTLQFIQPEARDALIRKIFNGMLDGSVLILSEKVHSGCEDTDRLLNSLHEQFKRTNGYSDLEISRKRIALENVMILDSVDEHCRRLKKVGFLHVCQWFQGMNFRSFLAIR